MWQPIRDPGNVLNGLALNPKPYTTSRSRRSRSIALPDPNLKSQCLRAFAPKVGVRLMHVTRCCCSCSAESSAAKFHCAASISCYTTISATTGDHKKKIGPFILLDS